MSVRRIQGQFSFVRPEEALSIPNSAGVYGFLYNPYQKTKLGIYSGSEESKSKVDEAKRALVRKLSCYNALKRSRTLKSDLVVCGPEGNAEEAFGGELPTSEDNFSPEDVYSLTTNEFISYLEMGNQSMMLSQALYCGMTINQGLYHRYHQHANTYRAEKPGTFGGRLAKYHINWEDVIFIYSPVLAPSDKSDSIKLLEKHMINMFNPILSIR